MADSSTNSEFGDYIGLLRERAAAFAEFAAERHEDPKGGLNAAGRKHFGVKKGVTSYSSASEEDRKRWVRWALRFTKTPKPLVKDGKPTRYALMFHAWGEPVPTTPAAVSAVHKKAETRARQLKMGEHAVVNTANPHADEEWLHSSENDFWEDVVGMDDADAEEHTGVMVAFYPDPDQALNLAVPGGEHPDDLHLTLAYLGQVGAELESADESLVVAAVRRWAAAQAPVTGAINGMGVFDADPPVTYACVDCPGLPAARQSLVETLDATGVRHAQEHGYTPHMTLAYEDIREYMPPRSALRFTEVIVRFAGHNTVIPLSGAPARLEVNEREGSMNAADTRDPGLVADSLDAATKAFSVEINGRQFVAAPATALSATLESAAMREPTIDEIAEQPLLWMSGRFVGANEPNRNGAYWSSGDLQIASDSVAHGPLNWLHEGRHIIGTISKAQYRPAFETADRRQIQPHIEASAGIWRWIYPDEAFVVQQASELGQLWYSMECISKEITCTGPNGCGNSVSYSDYTAGAACDHVVQRASIRQFNSPVFLGGAVIVPPTRPGWADADASVMQAASGIAEAAFDQSFAGQPNPDMRASDWESLMAQLVAYASN